MKFLVIFCLTAHVAFAIVPPFTDILSGLLGAGADVETPIDDDGAPGDVPVAASPRAGIPGGQILSSILGVKINLLSGLRNVVGGEQEHQGVDFEEDGDGSHTSSISGSGAHVGTSTGFESGTGFQSVSGFESSAGSAGAQMFSAGSGFAHMAGAHEASHASAYASQNAHAGYNYPAPSSGSGFAGQSQNTYLPPNVNSGYAGQQVGSNGGYVYERPPNQIGGGVASGLSTHEVSSSLSALESSSSSSSFSKTGAIESGSGSATTSGAAGLARIPIQVLTFKRNGINSGFESVIRGINQLQTTLGGIGSNSIERRRY